MPTCKEIAQTVASGELESASFLRRTMIRLHFLMCRHCRGYRDQLEELGRAARVTATQPDSQSLERLEAEVLSGLDHEG